MIIQAALMWELGPNNFVKDKEGLYEDAIKFKKANNNLKKENTKLKTTVRKLENELVSQQREMDEYIFNQNQGRLDFNNRYHFLLNL